MQETNINDLTAEQLNNLFNWISTTADSAQNFVIEQAPLVAQEILNYTFITNIIYLIFIVTFLIISAVATFIFSKFELVSVNDHPKPALFLLIMSGLIYFMSFLAFCFDGYNTVDEIIKVKTAPRIVIIDWIKQEMN